MFWIIVANFGQLVSLILSVANINIHEFTDFCVFIAKKIMTKRRGKFLIMTKSR